MPRLLGRELTREELSVRNVLEGLLRQLGRRQSSGNPIRELAARVPQAFFVAALSLLDTVREASLRQSLYAQLLECPEFLIQLTRPDRFSRAELLRVCEELMKIDGLLDVRLAHLAPGRQSEGNELSTEAVLHVLDVLDQISPGPRLVVILTHLTHHPEERIAAKATLLLGHRIRNENWLESHLASPDPRVRASVVEALWGTNTITARRIMWECLKDSNNRVVGNALVGLFQLDDPNVHNLLTTMLKDERPAFRWTAAWVMGYTKSQEYVGALREALSDPEPGVRQTVRKSLVLLRQLMLKAERAAAELAAAAAAEEAAKAGQAAATLAATETKEPAPPEKKKDDEDEGGFDLHLDGRYAWRM